MKHIEKQYNKVSNPPYSASSLDIGRTLDVIIEAVNSLTKGEDAKSPSPTPSWAKFVSEVFAEEGVDNEWREEEIKSLIRLILKQKAEAVEKLPNYGHYIDIVSIDDVKKIILE